MFILYEFVHQKCELLNKTGAPIPEPYLHTVIARQCPRHRAVTFSNYPYCRGMRMRLPQDTQRVSYDADSASKRRFYRRRATERVTALTAAAAASFRPMA